MTTGKVVVYGQWMRISDWNLIVSLTEIGSTSSHTALGPLKFPVVLDETEVRTHEVQNVKTACSRGLMRNSPFSYR